MPAVRNVLVVGGGAAGAAAAILLAEGGVSVELIEIKPDVESARLRHHPAGERTARAAPAGRLGPAFRSTGTASTRSVCARPTPWRRLIAELDDIPHRRARPARHHGHVPSRHWPGFWWDRAGEAGAKVRFGSHLYRARTPRGRRRRHPSPTAPPAGTTWCRRGRDTVPHSPARSASTLDQPVGMGIWRAFTARPASVTRTDLYYGGPCYIAGYCPTARTRSTRTWSRTPRTAATSARRRRWRSCASCPRPTTGRGTTPRTLTDPPGSTTRCSRPTCSNRRGTVAAWSSSATP